jgi:hypothetical protein
MRSFAFPLTAVLAACLAAPSTAVAAPAQPSAVQPSVVQPSVVQPSVVQPSVVQPSVVQPSVVTQLPVAEAAPVLVARYSFDGGRATTVPDDSLRGHTMWLVSRNGGAIRPVTHGPGTGVQFPPRCTGGGCPKAILRTPHSADLNPGARPLAFGASVRLARGQTTAGQNVVQKGYSAWGSQYKLQIDGGAGRPSCVLVGTRTGIKIVRSSVSVADGVWHAVQCHRIGSAFRILVDGAVRGSLTVPASLSVLNDRPLSIGGKGVYPDNDQFQGHLDDVYVRIG